jgi:hypothetical protein
LILHSVCHECCQCFCDSQTDCQQVPLAHKLLDLGLSSFIPLNHELYLFHYTSYLTRVRATGQEERNKPEFSAPKLYCLHLQEPESKSKRARALLLTSLGARAQESKRAREQESKSKSKISIAYIFRSQSAREQEQEREWRNPVPFKENYSPPRTCRSLIGCSPSAELSSRGRQNTWRENCPCTCEDYLLLRTQLSAPSYNGKCECGFPHL